MLEDQELGLCPGHFLFQSLPLSRNCVDFDPIRRPLLCLLETLLAGRELVGNRYRLAHPCTFLENEERDRGSQLCNISMALCLTRRIGESGERWTLEK